MLIAEHVQINRSRYSTLFLKGFVRVLCQDGLQYAVIWVGVLHTSNMDCVSHGCTGVTCLGDLACRGAGRRIRRVQLFSC